MSSTGERGYLVMGGDDDYMYHIFSLGAEPVLIF